MAKAYAAVSGEDLAAAMSYRQARRAPAGADPPAGRAALADGLRQALARMRRAELERGVCLVGPHRDDLELRIGEFPDPRLREPRRVRGRWRSRSGWPPLTCSRSGGEDPVLLLDNVFAELDSGRRERLAALVGGAEQVLVTAAVPGDVPAASRPEVRGIRGGGLACLTTATGSGWPARPWRRRRPTRSRGESARASPGP